jgi:hypothetical protein
VSAAINYNSEEPMGKKSVKRVPVTARAVLQRVNRLLAKDDEQLRWYRRGAKYLHLDVARNVILSEHVDFEAFARDAGALKEWEEIVG